MFGDYDLFIRRGGQLTMFVMIAIVVVVGIVGYVFFEDEFSFGGIRGSSEIVDLMADCIDFTAENSLYLVAYEGGYNSVPEKNFDFSPFVFPYYYYEGESYMPSLDFIEGELGDVMKNNLGSCFDKIELSGIDISYGDIDVVVDVSREGVEFVADSSVVLYRDEESMIIELSDHPVFIESKLYDIYEISRFFVEDQLDDPSDYCITCIGDMSIDFGLNFYLFPIFDDVVLVMIFDDDVEKDPLVFNFVNKYVTSDYGEDT